MFSVNVQITFENGVEKSFDIDVDPIDGKDYITDEQIQVLTIMFGGRLDGDNLNTLNIKTVDCGHIFINFVKTPVIFCKVTLK